MITAQTVPTNPVVAEYAIGVLSYTLVRQQPDEAVPTVHACRHHFDRLVAAGHCTEQTADDAMTWIVEVVGESLAEVTEAWLNDITAGVTPR